MKNQYEQALQTFVSEANEMLEETEHTLLDVKPETDSLAWVDSVFRHYHTIKGSAGLFGLDNIVEFTHLLESTLDKVRRHTLVPDDKYLELLIESNDMIKTLVQGIHGHSPAINADVVNATISKLKGYLEGQLTETVEKVNQKEATVHSGIWHISFRPHKNVFQDGLDPVAFIKYLKNLGNVQSVKIIEEALEAHFDDFDPEQCYLGFEIRFSGTVSRQDLLDAFEFTEKDADIVVIPPHSQVEQYLDLIQKLPDNNQRIGEILVQIGAISEKELKQGLEQQASIQTNQQIKPLIGQLLKENQHLPESVINAAVEKHQPQTVVAKTLRIEAEKLDQLIDLVGEMVITGARTSLLAHETGYEPLTEAMAQLERLVESIRDNSLQLRMVQIGDTFSRFKRMVRDTAKEANKNVELHISGAETELDKTFVEKLSDPLTHLVRNAIDHGIENAEERIRRGKNPIGKIRLHAFHDSGSIVIQVSDDGGGLDEDRVLKRAIEKGLVRAGESHNPRDIWRLIFEPGFSTRDVVTDLSGRGVGMDVVKRNIESLRGNIELESEKGVGCKFTIRLPLTLSIIDGFLFKVANVDYVIPLDNVVECLELREVTSEEEIKGKQFVNLRDGPMPFIRLAQWFGLESESDFEEEALVVVQFGTLKAGLVVDSLTGEYQTVVKSMGPLFEGLRGVSGATIMGNGEVAIILDIFALIQAALSQIEAPGRFKH